MSKAHATPAVSLGIATELIIDALRADRPCRIVIASDLAVRTANPYETIDGIQLFPSDEFGPGRLIDRFLDEYKPSLLDDESEVTGAEAIALWRLVCLPGKWMRLMDGTSVGFDFLAICQEELVPEEVEAFCAAHGMTCR